MRIHLVRGALAVAAVLMLASAHHQSRSIPAMTTAAKALLASMTPEQKGKLQFAFDDKDREFWHFIPTDDIPNRYKKPRMGLILQDMEPYQRHLASALLSAGLSQAGYIKAVTIMSLEDVLRILEKDTKGRRNPLKYHFSIFGEPSETGVWSYRVEGHHLSLHFTIVNGKLAATPTFFGANPNEVREGPRAGLRPLGQEEDVARELLMALDANQKKTAVVAEKAPADIITSADRHAALTGQPNGLQASKMNSKQKEMLQALLGVYISNVPEQVAEARAAAVKAAGNNLYFAWAGPGEKGAPHYYRVVGPTFLVEYDNTQNGANHTHTVWREFKGDFGEDLLKAHYKASH